MSCDVGIESFDYIVMSRLGSCWRRGESWEAGCLGGAGAKGQLSQRMGANLDKIWQIIGPYFQESIGLACFFWLAFPYTELQLWGSYHFHPIHQAAKHTVGHDMVAFLCSSNVLLLHSKLVQTSSLSAAQTERTSTWQSHERLCRVGIMMGMAPGWKWHRWVGQKVALCDMELGRAKELSKAANDAGTADFLMLQLGNSYH